MTKNCKRTWSGAASRGKDGESKGAWVGCIRQLNKDSAPERKG